MSSRKKNTDFNLLLAASVPDIDLHDRVDDRVVGGPDTRRRKILFWKFIAN